MPCATLHLGIIIAINCCALQCGTLQCIAVDCISVHCSGLSWFPVQCSALHCMKSWPNHRKISTQHIASTYQQSTYRNNNQCCVEMLRSFGRGFILQCSAVHYISLHCIGLKFGVVQCIRLHNIALECIALLYIAVQCSALPYSAWHYWWDFFLIHSVCCYRTCTRPRYAIQCCSLSQTKRFGSTRMFKFPCHLLVFISAKATASRVGLCRFLKRRLHYVRERHVYTWFKPIAVIVNQGVNAVQLNCGSSTLYIMIKVGFFLVLAHEIWCEQKLRFR